jgi:drug/metabolite transporter (DMT)-like permease
VISLGVAFAVLASVVYGLSDVLSGTVVRRHSTASLALWAQVTGLAVLGLAAAVRRPELSGPAVSWGLGAGAIGAFYTALQRGRTSVVTPVAGAGVIVPVLAGLLSGDPLGWRAGLGVGAAVLGILVVAAAPDDAVPRLDVAGHPVPGRTQPVPVFDACVPRERSGSGRSAGAALDVALVVDVAVQVGALAVTLLVATRHTRACLSPGRSLAVPAVAVGLLDVSADLLVTLAVDAGPLAVVGPLASLDPVVAVLVATVVLRERLHRLPALGVVVALVGIVLVATG